ncbi:hypothetical protein SAMN05444007_101145 [Cribrihabitans marinus]|uniref:Alpha/beta hydrolase family protein n=1 Tax=Cribrihabitans marinus TaxID=1227549 RepID=A0A1H6QGL5_9RHOB|nr:hypothetical protein [Cribrihabitans marinus]GGH18844.1 hypothetical protein GCM10010973_01880 [Cribrihabitans marinus]SEI42859.1 hypothetical protein SAMN05444007_101145 [Cribrihabitans marinus]
MSSAPPDTSVRRRRVFYIPGYDPFPPRRYRELYRREGAEQARISGYELTVSASADGTSGWRVSSQQDGQRVEADFEVLVWSDIVQHSMSATIPGTYLQLLRTAATYIGTGALWRLMRLRKGPVIAALYPVGFLLLQLLLALAVAGGGVALGLLLEPWAGLAGRVLAGLAGLAAAWWVLRAFRRLDGRFFAHYLMHDYAHTARDKGAYPAELEARLAAFRARIRAALASEVDEVLVVGHSSGAHLGISVLADLMREVRAPEAGPALSLLTLGQVVPMVSFLPEARRLRADLHLLSRRDDLTWVDVSAPGDGCCFALCDPVAVSGVAPREKRWPLVISAAFTHTLSRERRAALRWRFFRLHFQYLCAFDRPGDYDYFRITAGPGTLAVRYAGRGPSRSRIERSLSKYTDRAAA